MATWARQEKNVYIYNIYRPRAYFVKERGSCANPPNLREVCGIRACLYQERRRGGGRTCIYLPRITRTIARVRFSIVPLAASFYILSVYMVRCVFHPILQQACLSPLQRHQLQCKGQLGSGYLVPPSSRISSVGGQGEGGHLPDRVPQQP